MEHQLVSFKVGNEEYAVDILSVHEINRISEIATIPKSPDFIKGVINLRGKIIPVISLRKKFGLTEKENDAHSRIIVTNIHGVTIGLVVDSVSEVLRISSDVIEPPPPMVSGISAEFINGIAKLQDRLIMLLDINKLLGEEGATLSMIEGSSMELTMHN